MSISCYGRIKAWLKPDKVHKLQLTNRFTELAAAFRQILSGHLERGEKTRKLEEAFRTHFDTRAAIIFPHARTALHETLKALELDEGDEVLMAPLTIADMINSIHSLKLKPVFVDIELDTFCIDPEQLEQAVTPKAKVVFVTYLFGVVPDIEKICEIARKHGLKVIEDCSQCFNGKYNGQLVGTFGDAAIFSLTNFKVCSSLFGGMLLTNNEELARQLRSRREQDILLPQASVLLQHTVKNLIYKVVLSKWCFSYCTYFIMLILEKISPTLTYRLYSGNIKVVLGGFENTLASEFPEDYLRDYTEPQAYLGLASFARAAHSAFMRTQHGELLREALQDLSQIQLPAKRSEVVNAYWRFPILSSDMRGLKEYLLDYGIDSSPTYLCLCSQEPAFTPYHASMPCAERLKHDVLLLEVHEEIHEDTVRSMTRCINSYYDKKIKDIS